MAQKGHAYVKLKDPSSTFYDMEHQASVVGKEVKEVRKSARVKQALSDGQLVEVDEDAYDKYVAEASKANKPAKKAETKAKPEPVKTEEDEDLDEEDEQVEEKEKTAPATSSRRQVPKK